MASEGGILGGAAGGAAGAFALGDAYSAPLFVEAMNRNRGAIIDLSETGPLWNLPPGRLEDQHDHICRWAPWVRSYLVAQESIESMEFETEFVAHNGESLPKVMLSVIDRETKRKLNLVSITSPGRAVFEKQLSKVLVWAELREERAAEILTQIDNQDCIWGSIIPIQSDRLRRTKELIDAAVQMAVFVEMRFKHELACWRPADYSVQVQPMITTPGHGALPSGHCTQSYVTYEVLKALFNTMRNGDAYQAINRQFHRMAQRISTNRVVAGVHFPVDNVAGRILGKVLGEYFVYLCDYTWTGWDEQERRAVKPWNYGEFDGTEFDGNLEFDPATQPVCGADPQQPYYKYRPPRFEFRRDGTKRAPVLKQLFKDAQVECSKLSISF